jgi:hypothetical protein
MNEYLQISFLRILRSCLHGLDKNTRKENGWLGGGGQL